MCDLPAVLSCLFRPRHPVPQMFPFPTSPHSHCSDGYYVLFYLSRFRNPGSQQSVRILWCACVYSDLLRPCEREGDSRVRNTRGHVYKNIGTSYIYINLRGEKKKSYRLDWLRVCARGWGKETHALSGRRYHSNYSRPGRDRQWARGRWGCGGRCRGDDGKNRFRVKGERAARAELFGAGPD